MAPLLFLIGKAALSAAAPAAVNAAASSIASMRGRKQVSHIISAFNAAAAANELANKVKHLASPEQNAKLRAAMVRHQASLNAETKKIDDLLEETLRAQQETNAR